MTPQAAISLIQVADAVGDREKALACVQALRDALDGGLLCIVAGPRAHPIEQRADMQPLHAQYHGTCEVCRRPIRPGTAILYRRADKTVRHAEETQCLSRYAREAIGEGLDHG